MKRKIITLLMALSMTALLFGCGKKEETTPNEVPKQEETTETEEKEDEPEQEETATAAPEGMVKSYLTGEWIDEKIAANRPYAIMIGNTVDALPQYGLSQADVVYEVPVEGSYTRLMAIFQDITGLEKIGSVRSCRHYFVNFAREFDALYVHCGQAVYAEPLLAQENIHNISGMDYSVESSFYRDTNRKAPHNLFTSEEGLKAATEKKGYRTEYADTYKGHYLFAEEGTEVTLDKGTDALVISPGYFVNKPWFVYDESAGLYNRFEFKQEQVDGGTEGQLQVKNIIVQYCDWEYKDENGYMDINTLSSSGKGEGKYITNGKMIDVTWTKDNEDSPARYFDADGNEITLNIGNTWVCVVRDGYQERFQVYQTEEELQTARAAE